jgi:hypothetical protein
MVYFSQADGGDEEMEMADQETLDAIFADLDLCDLGMVLTTGKRRAKFAAHRAACFDALREMNKADGLDEMTIDEIFAELTA